jgi:hypothetical protein
MQGYLGIVRSSNTFGILFPESLNGQTCNIQKKHQGVIQPVDFGNNIGEVFILEGDYNSGNNTIIFTGGRQLMTGSSI